MTGKLLITIFAFAIAITSCQSEIVSVDPGGGGDSLTLSGALEMIDYNDGENDVVLVAPGTYDEQVRPKMNAGADSVAFPTIGSLTTAGVRSAIGSHTDHLEILGTDSNNPPILLHTSPTPNAYGFFPANPSDFFFAGFVLGADGVTMRNVELRYAHRDLYAMNGMASNWVWEDCLFSNGSGPLGPGEDFGFYQDNRDFNSDNDPLIGLDNEYIYNNCIIDGAEVSTDVLFDGAFVWFHGYGGDTPSGTAVGSGVTFKNCVVRNWDNIIHNFNSNGVAGTRGGLGPVVVQDSFFHAAGPLFAFRGACEDVAFIRNVVSGGGNAGTAVRLNYRTSNGGRRGFTESLVVANNLFAGVEDHQQLLLELREQATSDAASLHVVNNTFFDYKGTDPMVLLSGDATVGADVTIANNIFHATDSGSAGEAIELTHGLSSIQVRNNLFYGNNTDVADSVGATIAGSVTGVDPAFNGTTVNIPSGPGVEIQQFVPSAGAAVDGGDAGAYAVIGNVAGIADVDGSNERYGGPAIDIGAQESNGAVLIPPTATPTPTGTPPLFTPTPTVAPPPPIKPVEFASPDEESRGWFGESVAGVPDVTGDGRGDVVIGAGLEDPGSSPDDAGRAHIFDGYTGAHLQTLVSPYEVEGGRFGSAVSGISDVNGDGRGDVVIGADQEGNNPPSFPYDAGRAYVFDGVTGAHLYTLASPDRRSSGHFGTSVSGVSDVNGDGRGEVLIGAYQEGSPIVSGRAHLFDGATGAPIRTFISPNEESGGYFGISVSGVPDVNGDGREDVVIGARRESPGASPYEAGRAYIFDGLTGLLLQTLASPNEEASSAFGFAVSGISDVNGDGRGDVAVGASGESPGASPDRAGRAYVFDGSNGVLLYTLTSPNEQFEGFFGSSVSGVPDINGDGLGEVAIGAQTEDSSAGAFAGRVYIFDGLTGSLLHALISPNEQLLGRFGTSVSGVPDVDGDGLGDVVVGTGQNPEASPSEAGGAYLFISGQPNIGASPTSLAFGTRRIDFGPTGNKSVTVANGGLGDLTFAAAGIEITGDDASEFVITNSPSTSDLPYGTREVVVTFDPTSAGAKSANLTFTTNDPDEPTKNVSLAGTGVEVFSDVLADEFLVNSTVYGSQSYPDIATDGSGNSVITWMHDHVIGPSSIHAQRFDATGNKIGGQFVVNSNNYYPHLEEDPSIAMDDDGNFVIVWGSPYKPGENERRIAGQRFNAGATPVGGEFRVNSIVGNNRQVDPSVGMDADGNFAVAWNDPFGLDGDGGGIFARGFRSSGSARGPQFRVNSTTAGTQAHPSLSMNASGEFLVTWHSDGQDGDSWGVFAQRFNPDTKPMGGEFQVNGNIVGSQSAPDASLSDDGSFEVTWTSDDGGGSDIYKRSFDSQGVPRGPEVRVNTETADRQEAPRIGMSDDGTNVISWHSFNQDGSGVGVFAQTFYSNGSRAGGEFQVNNYIVGTQAYPSVAMTDDGDSWFTWHSWGQDDPNEIPGPDYGVYAKIYSAPPPYSPTFDSDGDGVVDATEDAGPNGGDANGDGIPDRDQANVVALPSEGGGPYVTVTVSDGHTLLDLQTMSVGSLPINLPAGIAFPLGLFDFSIAGVTPGGAATAELILPNEFILNSYFKYGRQPDNPNPHWYRFIFDGSTGAVIDGDRITLRFIDGDRGDDDLSANGVIQDPGGPAIEITSGVANWSLYDFDRE